MAKIKPRDEKQQPVYEKDNTGLFISRALSMSAMVLVFMVLATGFNQMLPPENISQRSFNMMMLLVVGVLLGWLLGEPFFRGAQRILRALTLSLRQYTPGAIAGALAGLTVGLVVGNLLALPAMISIYKESPLLAATVSGLVSLIMGPLTAGVFLKIDFFKDVGRDHWLEAWRPGRWLVDTSILVDGRLNQLAKFGLVQGEFVIPDFVVKELHQLADSSDPLKRNRGRLGLGALTDLKEMGKGVRLVFEEVDRLMSAKGVDEKLMELAQRTNTRLMTTDTGLAQVAALKDVEVVNLVEAANALKPLVLPGERVLLKIIKLGRESGQGVGYLEDGSMVVVEKGSDLVGTQALVEVTSVIQTVGGRLIFGEPIESAIPKENL